MDNDNKTLLLQQAIRDDKVITFDYVAKDFSISFSRKVHPTEVKNQYLWGMDLDKGVLRQFLIDGIQKLVISIPYPKWKEINND